MHEGQLQKLSEFPHTPKSEQQGPFPTPFPSGSHSDGAPLGSGKLGPQCPSSLQSLSRLQLK